MENLDSQLKQTLENDEGLILTASQKMDLKTKKKVSNKVGQVTNAAQLLRSHRSEIHTMLAMLTITSGGALFPVTAGIAGVLLLIDPIIESIGAYSDVALQFQLIFDYCITFNKMFQVLSRMLYLITIFSKNRRHFKLLMYKGILEDIKSQKNVAKSKTETLRLDQETSKAISKEVVTMGKIDEVEETLKSPEDLTQVAIQEASEKVATWKELGYDEAPDTIASGAIFPESIYEKIKDSLDDMKNLLLENVDNQQLQSLIDYDKPNLFGFQEEKLKRGRYGKYLTKPDIFRRWQVAGRKGQIISTLNEGVNHIGAGLLLMKLHIDTLFIYVEQHCTKNELALLHIAVSTSPEFIAYIEPKYEMEDILATRALTRLNLVRSSIIRDLGNDPDLTEDKSVSTTIDEVNADATGEVTKLEHSKEGRLSQIDGPYPVAVTAPVKQHNMTVPGHIMATATNVVPVRVGQVAPAPQNGQVAVRTRKPWYKFWRGGLTTRKRRRRGGVSSRRRGRAI